MSNMSYCRFHNTRLDLQDCLAHLFDEDLESSEAYARAGLVDLCRNIIDKVDRDDVDFMQEYEDMKAESEELDF